MRYIIRMNLGRAKKSPNGFAWGNGLERNRFQIWKDQGMCWT